MAKQISLKEKLLKDQEKVRKTLFESSFPLKILAETVYGCNLNCIMCPLSDMRRKPNNHGKATGLRGTMDMKLFEKLCEEIGEKGHNILGPNGKIFKTKLWMPLMGELFMIGGKAIKYITTAQKYNVPEVIFNTNGMLLNEKIIDMVLETELDQVYFGIDAASQKIYKQIRRGGYLPKVIKNVRYMIERRKKLGINKPKIYVQFIVQKKNQHETKEFKKFWLDEGAIVKIRRQLGWGQSFDTPDLIIPNEKRNLPCPWLIRTFLIHQNGMIPQCDSDHDGHYYAGNFNKSESTIEKIWLGELKKRREKHWQNDFTHPLCSKCHDWQCGLSQFYKGDKK